MEIRAADVPMLSPRVGAEDERAFRSPDKQKGISVPHGGVPDIAKNRCRRAAAWAGRCARSDNRRGLNRFNRGLDFACPLIALSRLLGHAPLDHGPKAWRYPCGQRRRKLVQYRRTDLKTGA